MAGQYRQIDAHGNALGVLRKSMTAAVRVDDLDVTQIAERCRRLITRGRKNTLHCTLGYCQINIH